MCDYQSSQHTRIVPTYVLRTHPHIGICMYVLYFIFVCFTKIMKTQRNERKTKSEILFPYYKQ